MTNEQIFATPRKVEDVADCYFYHTMELPGRGVIEGRDWDLRGRVDQYLGNIDFAGQRVLEVGPASGFLAFEMEKRGADVISVEVTDEHGWDFVPYPDARLEEVFGPRRIVMQQLKNSYWFSHTALQSKARVYYGDAYNLPTALGEFDIAVMGAGPAPLPRPAPNCRAMRKTSEITHYRGQVPSGFGGRGGLSFGSDAGKFSLAYVVAFQHAIFHSIPGRDEFHQPTNFDASTVSPRKSVHAFYHRWTARMRWWFNLTTSPTRRRFTTRPTATHRRAISLLSTPPLTRRFLPD